MQTINPLLTTHVVGVLLVLHFCLLQFESLDRQFIFGTQVHVSKMRVKFAYRVLIKCGMRKVSLVVIHPAA